MTTIKLAIPSKGRLMETTIAWFAEKGISIDMAMSSREYSARILKMPEIEIVLLSASEIPKELAAGKIDLGVTGQDIVRENIPFWHEILFELKLLNFGKADLVLAVPRFWVDVESIDDFDAVATNFRKSNGFRLRIATKYPNLVRSYLLTMGVADYQLVDSHGATEGTVKNNSAEAIADITSSGATLKANHLKIIGEQPVLRSQATLYLSHVSNWTVHKGKILENLTNILLIDKPDINLLSNA